MKKLLVSLAAAGIVLAGAAAVIAQEQEPAKTEGHSEANPTHFPIKEPKETSWSFAGPFGTYDKAQLQRGFKVYKEVCSACHSMKLVAFRTLEGLGYNEAQVKALAAGYKVQDGPNAQGEMFERDGRPADRFPSPFPNENAARAANGGAYPPDFSVLAKARTYERGFPWWIIDIFSQFQEQGPDYIHALLVGYEDAPQGFTMPPGGHYNKYFPGHVIAMPKPITEGQVTYDDGAPQTLEQYSHDVAAFMAWAAEPHMVARKRLGFQVMIFLLVLSGLLYFTKKKVWSAVH